MSEVFVMSRSVTALDGRARMTMPVRAFATKEAAHQACLLRTRALQEVLRMEVMTPSGGRSGLTVAAVLQEFGISGFEHFIDQVEQHESDLVAPPAPSIIIPR